MRERLCQLWLWIHSNRVGHAHKFINCPINFTFSEKRESTIIKGVSRLDKTGVFVSLALTPDAGGSQRHGSLVGFYLSHHNISKYVYTVCFDIYQHYLWLTTAKAIKKKYYIKCLVFIIRIESIICSSHSEFVYLSLPLYLLK